MRIKWFILTLLLLSLGAGSVEGQNTPFTTGYTHGLSARALGLGGSFTGVADDYTALYYNPAGLGQIQRMYLYGNLSFLNVENRSTYLGSPNASEIDFTRLDGFGVAVPVPTRRGSLVFSVGHQQVREFGGNMMTANVDQDLLFEVEIEGSTYLIDFPGTLSADEIIEGRLSQTSFGASVEVAPGVFVGGAANFWSGVKNYTWMYSEVMGVYDVEDIPTPGDVTEVAVDDYILTTEYEETYSGFNFTLGVLLKKWRLFQFGGAIQSPVTLKGERDWRWTEQYIPNVVGEERETEWDDGFIDHKIRSPWVFRFGGAVTAGPLMLTGDVELYDYSQIEYGTDPPEGDESYTQAVANQEIRTNLRNTMNTHIGAQVTVPGTGVFLRAGYAVYPSPWEGAPSDWDRKMLSVGGGFAFAEQIFLDVAYAWVTWHNNLGEYLGNGSFLDQEEISTGKILSTLTFALN